MWCQVGSDRCGCPRSFHSVILSSEQVPVGLEPTRDLAGLPDPPRLTAMSKVSRAGLLSLRCGGHYWILTKPPSGLCFLLTNPILVQRGGGSILREGESLLSPRGQFVSVLTQWEYPFLSVVIALRKSYDIVVATEEQNRKEVRWGTSGKDFPSSRKERYMREALSSSILLAF